MLANLLSNNAKQKFCLMLAAVICSLTAFYAPPALAAESTPITKTIYLNGYQPESDADEGAIKMSLSSEEMTATDGVITLSIDKAPLAVATGVNSQRGLFLGGATAVSLTVTLASGYEFSGAPQITKATESDGLTSNNYTLDGTISSFQNKTEENAKFVTISGGDIANAGVLIQSIIVTYIQTQSGSEEPGDNGDDDPVTTAQYTVTIDPTVNGTITVKDASNNEINNGGKVDDGTKQTITATPNEGYTRGGITVNGTTLAEDGTFTVNGENVTISATFTENVATEYTISFATPEGGNIIVTDGENNTYASGDKVAEGTELTIKAEPTTGYSFGSLTVDGTEVTGNTYNVTVTADVTISATFTKNKPEATMYTVAITTPTNGSIEITPALTDDKQVEEGTKLTVTAVPASGYRLKSLMANGTAITSGEEYTVSEDVTFTATFIEDYWTVTVTTRDENEGTLKVTPAVPTTGTHAGQLANGTTLTITATAKTGYELEGIYVNGEKIDGNSYTIDGADVTIEAKFAKQEFKPTVPGATEGSGNTFVSDQGTVTVDGTFAVNEKITITVAPATGWEVSGVRVNGTSATLNKTAQTTAVEATVGTPETYSYTIKSTDISKGTLEIVPTYTAQKFELTFTATGNDGTFAVYSGTKSLNAGKNVISYDEVLTIIPNPNPGYKVDEVTVNGQAIDHTSGKNEYPWTVKGDVTVAVTFTADTAPVAISYNKTANMHGDFTVTMDGTELLNGNKVNYGDVITITTDPEEDYKLEKITVTPNNGDAEEFTESPATYTVPDNQKLNNLTISATFAPIKNCSVNWTAPAAADGTMEVTDSEGNVLKNADKVEQGTTITVTCVAAKENFAPTLKLNNTSLTPTTVDTDTRTYTYEIEITLGTNNLTVSFADTREEVEIAAQTQSGLTVTFYSDEARKTRLTAKSSQTVDGYTEQKFTVRNTQPIYATITGATGKVPVVKIGTKGNQQEISVADNQFDFSAAQGIVVTTTWTTAPTEYTFKYGFAKGSEEMGNINIILGNGQTIATDQAIKLVKGTNVDVTITPDEGYRIKSVTGVPAGVTYTQGSASSTTTRQFNFNISANVTISATFEKIPQGSVTWTFNGLKPDATADAWAKQNGSFTMTIDGQEVPNEQVYTEDVEATYTVNANDQYYITKLTINGQTPANFNSQLRPSEFETTGSIKAFTRTGTTAAPVYTSTNAVVATFAHHKVTVKYTVNSDAVVATGMVKAYVRTRTTSATGVVTIKDTPIANGAQVDSKSELVFKATPTTGYKVVNMTVGGVEGDFETDTKGNPTSVYACTAEAPAYDTEADNIANYAINLELELLPVAVTITGNTGTAAHGTIDVTDVTTNTIVNNKDQVKVGNLLRVIVMANPGYQIKDVKINGETQKLPVINAVNATYTDIPVTGPMTIAVTWEKQKFLVSIGVTAGANLGVEGTPTIGTTGKQEASYESGTSVTLNANPAVGYEVVGWYLNGNQLTQTVGTGANQRVEPVKGNTLAIKVSDTPQSYLVAYAIKEYAQHNVFWSTNSAAWSEPDEKNPVWGSVELIYPEIPDVTGDASLSNNGVILWNYVVTVKAIPNPVPAGKYYFENWTVKTTGSNATYTVSDLKSPVLSYAGNSNATLTANFGRSWTVKSEVNDATLEGGKFTINLLGTGEPIDPIIGMDPTYVRNNGQVKLTAEPDPGYRVACFVINGKEQPLNSATAVTRTLTVTEDMTIGVRFYNPSGIEDVASEEGTEPAEEWFTIQGQYLGTEKPTATGVYLRRVGSQTTKVMVR